jgi:hypothetical protein
LYKKENDEEEGNWRRAGEINKRRKITRTKQEPSTLDSK